jgi:hypothetical protein
MIKLNIGKLPIKEFEVLDLMFEFSGLVFEDEIDVFEMPEIGSNIIEKYELVFEDEDNVFEMSEVIGHHKAMHIVNHYGWVNAQELANEYRINEPLTNIETVASYIIYDVIKKYIED